MNRNTIISKPLFNTTQKYMERLIHVTRWVLGYPTLMNVQRKFEIRGPSWWYQLFLIVLLICQRIYHMITKHILVSKMTLKIVEVMYEMVRTTEVVCAIMCLYKYSKYRAKRLLEFKNNLMDVNQLLKRRDNRVEKYKYFFHAYLILSFSYVAIENILKQKKLDRWIQGLKMMIMDVAFLQFMEEICECIKCMQILNKRLFDKRSPTVKEKVDFDNCRIVISNSANEDCDVENSAIVEAYQKIKSNLLIVMEAFAFPVSK